MGSCFICGKQLGVKEGFASGVDKECRAPKKSEDEVVVCSENCKALFEERFSHKGRPVDHFSRITGYMQRVSNWNEGKRQEFLDRKRYSLGRDIDEGVADDKN